MSPTALELKSWAEVQACTQTDIASAAKLDLHPQLGATTNPLLG